MENLKPLLEILQPDERNLRFVRADTFEPPTLTDHYAEIAVVVLNPLVPENVRSYFATIQNVCLYSWFAYDLYAVVQLLCSTVVEMALRARLPWTGEGRDGRALSKLLAQANKRKLIKEDGFSHRRELKQNVAERRRTESQVTGMIPGSALPTGDYAEELSERMRILRNALAHPRGHSIFMPGDALFQLRLTAEFINQLFKS